jgi:hypothetical protein
MAWCSIPSRYVSALLAAAALSCATASSEKGEKGRLVAAPLSPEKLDAAYAPKKIALLIGISRFDDAEWNGLRYPEKDAEDLAQVLRDRSRGAFDDVEILRSAPTREELRAALRRLADRNRDERDTVLVYVSSHGTLARDARGELRRYLVMRDTRIRDVPATALSMDDLKSEFDALRSRRKVLVLAACHSGGGKSLLPASVQRELAGTKAAFFVRPIEEVSRATVVLAASDWGETAREDEGLRNDIYTHFLVEALREPAADRNVDGAVTVSEAHDYARRRTYEFTDGRQRPSAETTEVGADPIVLVGRVERRGRPELYSYAPRLDGFTVRIDGREVTELPGGFAVEPGKKHRIQLAKGTGPLVLDTGVALRPGERLDLEALLRRSEGPWEVAPRLALVGFLDGASRRDVLGPSFAFGATLTRRDWPSGRFGLRLDLLGGTGRATSSGAGYDYTTFTAGASLPWRFHPLASSQRLALIAGPRFSLVRIERAFGLDLEGRQTYTSFAPGVVVGAGYDYGRITFGAEFQLDYTLIRVDQQTRSSAFGQLLMGAGWRF